MTHERVLRLVGGMAVAVATVAFGLAFASDIERAASLRGLVRAGKGSSS